MVGGPSAERSESRAELQADALVGGHYRLVRRLGEGGMGVVWEARDEKTDRRVALKLLKSVAESKPGVLARFRRESRALTAVDHPNIVRTHEIASTEHGSPVIVMDLLEGESLAARLARSALSVAECAKIILPVIDAVAHAHAKGIVHRDLKPDNIFLATDAVKVVDFGIAKFMAPEALSDTRTGALTETGDVVGTPLYMSPEQVFGEKEVDSKADIWALAVIIYECLVGTRPFVGENVGRILKMITSGTFIPLDTAAPHVPKAIAEVVASMLCVEREARLGDLRQVVGAFGTLTDSGVSSRSSLPAAWTKTRMGKDRRPLGIASGAVALLLAGGVGAWLQRGSPPGPVALPPVVATPSVAATVASAPPALDVPAVPVAPPAVPVLAKSAPRRAVAAPTPPASASAKPHDVWDER